ncbi:MAG: aminopeptidase P family protein [Spirochaetaceae bacterium]|nr:MAG: aminopeptidase P family protein [Spirochaetaceae bacterium]
MKETNSELVEKLSRLRALMAEQELGCCVLRRTASLAWITCGARTWVNTANGEGPVTAIVTPERHLLVSNNIESPRLAEEEGLAAAGWSIESDPWYGPARSLPDILHAYGVEAASGSELVIGSDVPLDVPGLRAVNLGGQLARVRSQLLPVEQARAATLGADCATAMLEACEAVAPGQSEYDIAALLWEHTQRRGIQAIVNLVAVDERIHSYRHPVPTAKVLQRHAMLVLCGRRDGLVSSLTRLVHFGPVPEDIRLWQRAVAAVDASMIAASRPGVTTGEVLACAVRAYAEAGFDGAWREHHQGGVVAYEPREYLALPDSGDLLHAGMCCAWNPSLPGAKSEDTILVEDQGPRVLTEIPGWPMLDPPQGAPDGTLLRPDILVR